MAFQLAEYLVTDDLTILLGLIAAAVFLLQSFYRPQPLVHPILLGRQSDVARVRNPGESAVYRNYGTGMMGRFPVRPHKDVHVLGDLVRSESDAPRTLWNTRITNPALQDRAAAFATGLLRLTGIKPHESNALILLNDGIEFIVADLALAAHSIPSFTLTSADLLAPVLEAHPPSVILTQAELLPQLLELIYDSGESTREHYIVVVGEPSTKALATVASKIKVLKFAEVEREGIRVEKTLSPQPIPTDVFTVSFYKSESGHLQGAQFTHENLTAGVAAARALVPIAQGISQLDTIVSAYSLSSAFGRAIAYSAIFEGACFATLDSAKVYHFEESEAKVDRHTVQDILSTSQYRIPPPTIFFLKAEHLRSVVDNILSLAKKSFLFRFAWRHKISALTEGFITKDSLWDRLVFDGARAEVIGHGAGTLRNVVVSGGDLTSALLTPSRVAFSTPFVNAFTHPAVAGPVLASHPLDLQDFSEPDATEAAPVGPPSINVEAKLVGVNDDGIEKGSNPHGVLLVRGPPVGKLLGGLDDYVNIPSSGSDNDWVGTGVSATVNTNGAFQLSK